MSNTTVPCTLCGGPTYMLGAKLCIRCWELSTRVQADPDLARKVLAELDEAKGGAR